MAYTARASATITVNVGLDGDMGDAPPQGGKWEVTAEDPFGASDYFQAGTGDATLTGDVVDGREYKIVFQHEEGFVAPTPPNITADSGTPQSFDGDYETSAATFGAVTVTTQAGANWVMTGALGYTSGNRTSTQTISNLPYDTYTATFEDNLIGYTEPVSPDTDDLVSATLDLTGSYTARSSAGSFTVDVERNGSDPGSWGDWTVTSDAPFTGDFSDTGTGDGSVSGSVYEGRDYTCVWDPEPSYSLSPTSQSLTATTGSQEFATNYDSADDGDISIAIVGVNVPEVRDATTWTLFGPGQPAEGTPGTGNTVLHNMPTGDYYVRWGWLRDYWTRWGYDDRSHPHGANPTGNGPWTSDTKTLSASTSLTFNDPYTYRGVQSKPLRRFGMSLVSDQGYGAGQTLTNMFGYVRKNWGGDWPNLWPTGGTSECFCQITSPPGKDGDQPYWIFWRGKGTITVSQGTAGTPGRAYLSNFYCNGDTAGQAGHRFTVNINQEPGDTLVNQPENGQLVNAQWGQMKATNIDGGDPLRDIEIVHADYCGNGADKSFRSVDPVTGNFVTEQSKGYFGNTSIARFLDHTNRVNYPEKDYPKGRYSPGHAKYKPDRDDWEAGEYINSTWEINLNGKGREADSTPDGENHTVLQGYQQQIDICNSLDQDYWICFPTWDNPELEQAIIDAIEAPYTGIAGSQGTPGNSGLRSNLKVYIEWSNEVWNSGSYRQGQYAVMQAKRKAGISPSGPASQGYQDLKDKTPYNEYYGANRYTADRLVRIVQRYKATIGETAYAARCSAVLAAQSNHSAWPYVREAVNDPKPPVSFDGSTNALDHIDYWSIAYYYDYYLGEESTAPGASNYESAYQSWYTDFKAELASRWDPRSVKAGQQAAQNGWKVLAYEGGGGQQGADWNVPGHPVVTDAQWWYYGQRHINSYQVAVDVYESLEPYFELLCEFNAPATWGAQFGCWGVVEANTDVHLAYRYHAMIDWSHMNPRT